MKKGKTLIIFLLILFAFFVGCNSSSTKEKPQIPDEEIISPNPEESEEENSKDKLRSEQIFNNFKGKIDNGASFVIKRKVEGLVLYDLEVYYSQNKFYTITTTIKSTHKLYTEEFVYTNSLSEKVKATKTISILKEEFLDEILNTDWQFNSQIQGDNKNFTTSSMEIVSDSEINFIFERVEKGKVQDKITCNIKIIENLNLKETVCDSLKDGI